MHSVPAALGWLRALRVATVVSLVSTGLLLPPTRADARDLLPSFRSRTVKTEIERPAGVPTDDELEAQQALIGDIEFDVQDIFAIDTPEEDFGLFRLANALHVRTRPETIAHRLLVRTGDRYSRRIIEESERLLRALPFLIEVRIVPVAWREGRVHLKVFTRDVWTLKPGISVGRSGGANSLGVGIEEGNLFGYGKSLSLDYKSTVDRTTTTLGYRDTQFLGSRWILDAQYGDNSDGRKQALIVEQPFYALDTRRSMGVRLLDDERVDSVYDLGEQVDQYRTRQRSATVFFGVSDGLQGGWARRWTAGWTFDEARFEAIASNTGLGYVPPSRRLVYPWIRHERIESRYVKFENLDQIGRIEDLNLGWESVVQLGLASTVWNADRNALIWDAALTRRFAFERAHISEVRLGLTGRVEHARVNNGKLSLLARYSWLHGPNVRTLVSLGADVGTRLDPDQRITLGGDSGLRGYPLRYQAGSGRVLFTAEQRFFTDWFPFRLVRVGGAAFFDMGRTWGENPWGPRSVGMLRDVGIGLRIGQIRSGLGNVTHVNLAFPLDAQGSVKRMQFVVETKASF